MEHKYLAKKYWNTTTTPMGAVASLGDEGHKIINLSLGDPDYITNEKIIAAAMADAQAGHTRYTDALGDPELRGAISHYYHTTYGYFVEPSEVMAVVGACHGMYLVLEALLDEDDEVIIHEPYFTPYLQQIQLAGGKAVSVETYEEEGFEINIERLISKITPKTKAIIINSPNNPTGACFSIATLQSIAEVALQHDLLIIADDVYGAFSYYTPFIPITTLEGMKERTITVGSFSKDYTMTGWRIGYVMAPPFIINCIKDINEGICFTAPSISQRAALHALRLREEIQPTVIAAYKERVDYAYERIQAIPNMSVLPPQGTFYLFINIKATGLSSQEVSKRILEEAKVLVIPGDGFGASGEGYIRIACTLSIEKLKIAFDEIEKMEIFHGKVCN